jgi:hypothetical protein
VVRVLVPLPDHDDPRLLTGVVFGQLGAAPEARQFYGQVTGTAPFQSPVAWADLKPREEP